VARRMDGGDLRRSTGYIGPRAPIWVGAAVLQARELRGQRAVRVPFAHDGGEAAVLEQWIGGPVGAHAVLPCALLRPCESVGSRVRRRNVRPSASDHARLPPGLSGVLTRPAMLPHPWGATSCPQGSSTYYSLFRIVAAVCGCTAALGSTGRCVGDEWCLGRVGEVRSVPSEGTHIVAERAPLRALIYGASLQHQSAFLRERPRRPSAPRAPDPLPSVGQDRARTEHTRSPAAWSSTSCVGTWQLSQICSKRATACCWLFILRPARPQALPPSNDPPSHTHNQCVHLHARGPAERA